MRLALLLAAGLLGGGLPALSQTAPTDPADPAALPAFDESIVVSASLEPTEREEVPASVTVIDAEEIEARQAESLSEVLATVPGITVAQAGGPGQQTSLFLRGAESEHTLLLWNGIPLNDPYFGSVNWQLVPTDGVERVEVVRGPFSALYGSNALGGVVQVFSAPQPGVRLRLEGGEHGYARAGLAAAAELGTLPGQPRLDVTGHLRRGGAELPNDSFDSEELMARSQWTLRPGMTLGLLVRANDSETGIPVDGVAPTPRRRIDWEEREVAVPFRVESGHWEVDAQLSRTWFDAGYREPDDPFGFTFSDTESEGLRGRAVATWRRDDDLWVAFGSEAERLEVSNVTSFGPNLDGSRQRTWAVFGQAGWGIGRLHLDLGLRRDDNDVYGEKTSLRTGAVVDLGAGVRLRASYGEAFRAPSLGELFFPFSGNPGLQPETGESWEAGIEREADGWRLALTGFDNRRRNLIDFDFVNFRNVNVGRGRSRGVEAEAGFDRGMVSLRWNGTWMDTEDEDTGLELLRRPERSSNLVVTVRPTNWTFNLEGRWVGERPDVDPLTFGRAENPSFLRVDLAARWRALSWLAPYVRVENAADEDYQEVLGYPSPGRTWIGGVAVEF